MKIEEVLKTMERNKHLLGLPDQGDTWRQNANTIACDMAISALEKQIPKEPKYKYNEKYPSIDEAYWCDCGVMFIDWENNSTNYCGNCGQRLKREAE